MSRKTSSSAPSRVVQRGQLDRVARVAQIHELTPFDDAAGVTSRQGMIRLASTSTPASRAAASASPGRTAPS